MVASSSVELHPWCTMILKSIPSVFQCSVSLINCVGQIYVSRANNQYGVHSDHRESLPAFPLITFGKQRDRHFTKQNSVIAFFIILRPAVENLKNSLACGASENSAE